MRANHHDADTSDSAPASDVHHSSASKTLPDANVRVEQDGATRRNGETQRGHAGRKIRLRSGGGVTSEKTADARNTMTRAGRSALEGGTVNNAAAVCGPPTKPHARLVTKLQGELLNDVETRLKHVWPSALGFEWTTPCVTAMTGRLASVGSAVSSTKRREERRRVERHSAKTPRDRQREKKRALSGHLSKSGTSVGQLLQESTFAMGDPAQQQFWREQLDTYTTIQPAGSVQLRMKKPRLDTDASKQRRRQSRLKTIEEGLLPEGGVTEDCVTDLNSRSISLKVLMDVGLLNAGKQIVVFSTANTEQRADLREDGCIHFQGHQFASASAFAHHIQQIDSPDANGEDGWKHVAISGRPLVDWVAEYPSAVSRKRM